MPFGVVQVNLAGEVIYANKSAFKLLGVKSEHELIGIHYAKFDWTQFDENEKPLSLENHALSEVLSSQTVVTSSIQGVQIDGVKRWYSINAAPVFNNENELVGAISNFADITEKIERDKKQKEESARYKILVENIKGVVWETVPGTQTFSYVSPKAEELLGFPKEEWLKQGFWQSRLYPEDKERVISYEINKINEIDHYQLEYRMVRKDGGIIWVRDLVEVVNEDGKAQKLRGITLDITENKNSRLLLRESEQRYKQMVSEAPYAITIYDRHGVLIAANAKCEEYWLVDLKDYIGQFNIFNNDLFITPTQKETIEKAFKGEMGELIAEIPLTHANQSKKTYRLKYYPLFDTKGEVDNVIYFTEDITDYVKAERKTKREESLKQGILDALDEAILVIDEKGIIISVNKNLTIYVKDQPYSDLEIGKSVFDFIEFFDESNYLKNGIKSILDQKVRVLDHEMRLADGKWYNLRATPLGEPFGAVIAWQNINTRKEIEIALEKSLKKYRSIYNKAPVMMHSINDKLQIISVSDFWLEKMGYERNEVIGKTPIDFMAGESMSKISPNLKKLFEHGEVKNIAYKYVKKSGEEMDVILSAVAEYDEEGKFERSITGMLDVTDLKAAERKLQESQFRLLESQRISKIANYEYIVATGEFIPSDEMTSMMGFSKEDRDISVIQKLIHPEDVSTFAHKLERCIQEGKDFFHIYRIFHLITKKVKWISGRGKMIKDEKGKVIRMIGTVQDITEQKHAEQKIRRLTDRVLLATEIANLGVWEYDRDTEETFWEDQMYSIFSNTDKPLTIDQLKNYFVEDDRKVLDDHLKMIKDGINFLESDFRVKIEEEEKYLRAFTRILRDDSMKIKGMVGVIYDITADKRLQMQLESSLEEKNVLIKEVHHRVKNNMQLISSILALKSYDLDNDKSKAIFNEVNDRIKAMSVIHDKLYTFYNVSEINVGEYLNHIAKELQTLQGSSNIVIEVVSKRIILDVEKALLIGLMVSEMVSNAVKHGFEKNQNGTIKIHFSKQGRGGKFTLRVLNDGKKMEPNILESSTGLGVSLVKTFVKQLGGKVEVEEKENGLKAIF
jgi:PAS domain S-box-containing protein